MVLSISPGLGKLVEQDEEREGGEGDIELNPFAESTQHSAASSYHSDGTEEDGGRGRAGRGRSALKPNTEITPANSREKGSTKGKAEKEKEKEKGRKKSVKFETPVPVPEVIATKEEEATPSIAEGMFIQILPHGFSH